MSSPETRTLADARWSCGSCSRCCREFRLGPVDQPTIDGLVAAGIEELWPAAADGWLREEPGPGGKTAPFLRHTGEGCVFLQDDGLCAIHRLLGAEAKPAFCRQFPFRLTRSVDGDALTVRAECGGLHETFETGQLISEQVEEARAIPHIEDTGVWGPDQVVILPRIAIDLATWGKLEPVLLDLIAQESTPPEAHVAAIRGALYRALGRPEPEADPEGARAAMGHVLQGVHEGLKVLVDASQTDTPASLARSVYRASALLDRAIPRFNEPLPELTEPAMRYLGVVLRNHLLGRRFRVLGGLPMGLGAQLLHITVARLGVEADGPHGPADLGPELSNWLRVLHHPVLQHPLKQGRFALAAVAMNTVG